MVLKRIEFLGTRRTRTIPTLCRYCGAKVFFFTDEFGAKVFFDHLGPPWPKHECAGSIANIPEPTKLTGRSISTDVEFVHESEYGKLVLERNARRESRWKPPIVTVSPNEGDRIADAGVLRELIKEVDIFKRVVNVRDTPIGRKLLGKLAATKWGQVTVHVDDLAEDNIAGYTMLIDRMLLTGAGLRKGTVVLFEAEAEIPPFGKPIWICRSIEMA